MTGWANVERGERVVRVVMLTLYYSRRRFVTTPDAQLTSGLHPRGLLPPPSLRKGIP
jgi:hypothetical protein